MRINDPRGPKDVNVAGPSSTAGAHKAHGKGDAHKAQAGHDSVKVNVSAKARELASQSQIDEAKVSRLREQIASGQFKVDARAIATKLVGEDA